MARRDSDTGKMVFEAAEILPLIEEFQTAISLHDLAGHLGASKRQIELLYRAGHLRPLVPAPERGAVRNVVFARSHLDEVLARIDSMEELGSTENGWHPVAYVCQRGAGPFPDVYGRIMSGHLKAKRHSVQHGIASIRVNLDDALA